jgi:hypothetical protein
VGPEIILEAWAGRDVALVIAEEILGGLTLALGDRNAETILRILEATDLARITNTGMALQLSMPD